MVETFETTPTEHTYPNTAYIVSDQWGSFDLLTGADGGSFFVSISAVKMFNNKIYIIGNNGAMGDGGSVETQFGYLNLDDNKYVNLAYCYEARFAGSRIIYDQQDANENYVRKTKTYYLK